MKSRLKKKKILLQNNRNPTRNCKILSIFIFFLFNFFYLFFLGTNYYNLSLKEIAELKKLKNDLEENVRYLEKKKNNILAHQLVLDDLIENLENENSKM